MKSSSIVAACSLFASMTAAVPLIKRVIVTNTVTSATWTTVDVTTTITVDPNGAPMTASSSSAATRTTANVQAAAILPAKYQPPSSGPAAAPAPAPSAPVSQAPAQAPAPSPSSSSSAPQPSSAAPAPAVVPSSSSAPPPSSAAPASSGSTAISSGGSCTEGSPCTGDLTTYDVGLGACGQTSSPGQNVVALSYLLMGSASNGNSFCGKGITINMGGKSAQATVVDKCMGCDFGSVDMSTALYNHFGFDGRAHGATWYFN